MPNVNILGGVQTVYNNNQMDCILEDTKEFQKYLNFPCSSPGFAVVFKKVLFGKNLFSDIAILNLF